MKLLATTFVPSLVLALFACGGAAEPVSTAPTAASEPQPTPADAHGKMPAQVVAFHDVLRPLWHDESAERQAKTCSQADQLDAAAAKMSEVVAPDPATWAIKVGELRSSIGQLKAACGGSGDFQATFSTVHDGFHALTAMLGDDHDHHQHKHAPEHGHGHGQGHGHEAPPAAPAPNK